MEPLWFNPTIFKIGPLEARWYGALMCLSILVAFLILRYLSHKNLFPLPRKFLDSFLILIICTGIAGARLGYVMIYHPEHYSENWFEALAIWKGGLSFHGGLLLTGLMTYALSKLKKVSYFGLTDCLVLAFTPGLFLGRIGNYINGELYGRVTDSWIGVVFPSGGPFPRHPSQIYEAIFEGLVLFILGVIVFRKQRYSGIVTVWFLASYALIRFVLEFLREPDVQLGYLKTYFTMGQILSLMMLPIAFAMFKASQAASSDPSENSIPSRA